LTKTNAAAALRLAFSAVNELSKYVIGTIKDLKGQQSDTKWLKKKVEELQQNLEDRERRTEQLEGQLRAITVRVKALEEKGEQHTKESEEKGEKALMDIHSIFSAGVDDLFCDPRGLYDSGIEDRSVWGRCWASQKLQAPELQTTSAATLKTEDSDNSGRPKASKLRCKRPQPDTEPDESSDDVSPKHKKGHVRQGKCLFLTLEMLSQQEETPDCAKLADKTLKQLRIEIGAQEVGALTKEQENQLGQKKKPLAAYSKAYVNLFNELRDSEHWPEVQTTYKEIKGKQVKKAKTYHAKKLPTTV